MAFVAFNASELYRSYKNWIVKNPEKAGDFETTAKWISYFVAGRINNTHIVSELVYCLSNLLVFFNDRLIREAKGFRREDGVPKRLKEWMTVLEYSEVFLELSGRKLWGKRGQWILIVCIQVFKCLSRLVLIKKYKEPMIENPLIPVLDRVNPASDTCDDPESTDSNRDSDSASFTLKRSGKVIRKVDSVPLGTFRNWQPVSASPPSENVLEKDLVGRQTLAETLYITRPIVHLLGSAWFGYNTWKPWSLSVLMDVASLHFYYTCLQMKRNSLTKHQRLQLSKRTLLMVMYLMRSPLYEKFTQRRIEGVLKAIGNNIPLAGIISQPLLNYLPFWQGTYSYIWST